MRCRGAAQQQVIDESPTPAATGQMGRNVPGNFVSQVNSKGVELRWEPPDDGADGYSVWRNYGGQPALSRFGRGLSGG